MEKRMQVLQLLAEADMPPQFLQFFDVDSVEMLDDKIEVLEALRDGKEIAEIPKFYDVLELMPTEGIWD